MNIIFNYIWSWWQVTRILVHSQIRNAQKTKRMNEKFNKSWYCSNETLLLEPIRDCFSNENDYQELCFWLELWLSVVVSHVSLLKFCSTPVWTHLRHIGAVPCRVKSWPIGVGGSMVVCITASCTWTHQQIGCLSGPGAALHCSDSIDSIGGWGELNRGIVSCRSCVITRGLVA